MPKVSNSYLFGIFNLNILLCKNISIILTTSKFNHPFSFQVYQVMIQNIGIVVNFDRNLDEMRKTYLKTIIFFSYFKQIKPSSYQVSIFPILVGENLNSNLKESKS